MSERYRTEDYGPFQIHQKVVRWICDRDDELRLRAICAGHQNREFELPEAIERIRSLPGFPPEWSPGDHLEIEPTYQRRIYA